MIVLISSLGIEVLYITFLSEDMQNAPFNVMIPSIMMSLGKEIKDRGLPVAINIFVPCCLNFFIAFMVESGIK